MTIVPRHAMSVDDEGGPLRSALRYPGRADENLRRNIPRTGGSVG